MQFISASNLFVLSLAISIGLPTLAFERSVVVAQEAAQQSTTDSQPVPPARARRSSPERETVIFRLRYGDVQYIAEAVSKVGGGALIVPHLPTNSLVVQGTKKQIPAVRDLIKELDTRAGLAQSEGRRVQVFQLKNIRADQTVLNALRLTLSRGNIVADEKRNFVIVAGDDEEVGRVNSLLQALDAPQPSAEKISPRKLRIAWLIDQQNDRAQNVALPDDLKKVGSELERFGFENPSLTAHLMIQTVDGGNFEVQSTLEVNGQAREIRVVGSVEQRPGKEPLVNISISTLPEPKSRISTGIIAPPNHPVVLCVSPTGKNQSVFVVEVIE